MNITLNAPPVSTGNTDADLKQLNDWCIGFYMQMKRILYSIDTSNIIELNASRINGVLPLEQTSLKGLNVNISGDTFSLRTPDGSQYLTLDSSGLKFHGKIV